jgi:hypothetical protein
MRRLGSFDEELSHLKAQESKCEAQLALARAQIAFLRTSLKVNGFGPGTSAAEEREREARIALARIREEIVEFWRRRR